MLINNNTVVIGTDGTSENGSDHYDHVSITPSELTDILDSEDAPSLDRFFKNPENGSFNVVEISLPAAANHEENALPSNETNIPLALYEVGGEYYVSGWQSADGCDLSLKEFCDDERFIGQKITIHHPTPKADEGNEGTENTLLVELTDTEEFIDLPRIKALFMRIQSELKNAVSFSDILISKYYGEFLQRSRDKDIWKHQPAVLLAIGEALHNAEEEGSTLVGSVCSPTGTGKTHMEANILADALKSDLTRPIYVTSRTHLVDQSREKMEELLPDLDIVIYDGRDKSTEGDIITTTYHSVNNLLDQLVAEGRTPGLIIWDEAHNLLHRRSELINHRALQNTIQLGFTATPGIERSLSDIGMRSIVEVPLAYTIESGCTPPITVQRAILKIKDEVALISEDETFPRDIKSHLVEAAIEERLTVRAKLEIVEAESLFEGDDGLHIRPTLVEAQSLEEAGELFEGLRDMLEQKGNSLGDRVGLISSEQNYNENRRVIQEAREGLIDIVVAVDMLSEGIDLPRFEVIIIKPWRKSQYRPFQDMGRVMRISPNGNPCKIIEIWPYTDADKLGYRSALDILRVREGDPRVPFQGRREYEENVRRLRELDAQFALEMSTMKSYYYEDHILITTPGQRDQSMRNVVTLPDVGRSIVPKYMEYLREGGDPILRIVYKRDVGLTGWVDEDAFEEIAGFRWRLIPYFRLSEDDLSTLTRVMYQMEVDSGLRLPLSILEDGDDFGEYARELYSRVSERGKVDRDQIILQIMEDFGIQSSSYTLNSIVRALRDNEKIGPDVDSARKLAERILVREVLDKYAQSLPLLNRFQNGGSEYVFIQNDLISSTENLFDSIEYAIYVRIKNMVAQITREKGIYTVDGTRLQNEPFYQYFEDEILQVEAFLNELRDVSSALRFKTTYFDGPNRTNYLTSIHTEITQQVGSVDITVPIPRLLKYVTVRMKQLGFTDASKIAAMDDDDYHSLLLIPIRRLQSRVNRSEEGVTWSDFVSIAARYLDQDYAWSHDVWNIDKYPELIENLVNCIKDANLNHKEIESLTTTNLLQFKVDGRAVFPAIYVPIPTYLRSDGRSRSSFRAFCKKLNKQAQFNGITAGMILNDVKQKFGIRSEKKKKMAR